MFPAPTSLIPVQVALARFLESQGLLAALGNYPYWYLGTTPLRYLTGPILAPLLALLHRFLPNLSLFEIMFGLIGVMWMIGGVGVYLLVVSLANPSTSEESLRATIRGVLVAFFYLFGPIVPFLFRFSDGLYLTAFSVLPFILVLYLKLLKNWTRKLTIYLSISISFIILLDSLILPSLFLGMIAIFLAHTGWTGAEQKLKKSLLLIACSLLLATFWYTPGYWLTLLQAPSFGGKGLALVIVWLGKLFPVALALTTAIFSVRFFKKKDSLRDFGFYWLFIFGFLTLMRFLSDPDFWLDWSSYGVEIQMGMAIGLGMIVKSLKFKVFSLGVLGSSLAFYFLLFGFIFNKYVLGTFQRDITQTVEYRIGRQLNQIANPSTSSGRVFLSGTTAFWLNAFFDIPQVRGGRDQAAKDSSWRNAVWEIREGEDPQKSLGWFKKLRVEYFVVHTQESEEFYHDFSHPEKFEAVKSLKKVFSGQGDVIYRVEE